MKHEWKKVSWDGNLSLGFECWRKKFGRGDVSVGCGEFLTICYSYGDNSKDSYSGTRWRPLGDHLSEEDAMKLVDANEGKSTGSSYHEYLKKHGLEDWDPAKHGPAVKYLEGKQSS